MVLIFTLALSLFANDTAHEIERLVRLAPPYTAPDLEFVVGHLRETRLPVPAARKALAAIMRQQPELIESYLNSRPLPPPVVADLILASQVQSPELARALRRAGLLRSEAIGLALADKLPGERADVATALAHLGVRDPAIEDALVSEIEELRLEPKRLILILEQFKGMTSDRAVAALGAALVRARPLESRNSHDNRLFRRAAVLALGAIPTRASSRTLRAIEGVDDVERALIQLARLEVIRLRRCARCL